MNSDFLTPRAKSRPNRAPRPFNWFRLLLILAAVILASGTTGYIFRSAIKSKVWDWRAKGLTKQAEQLIQSGNPHQAFQLALASYKLNPSSLEGLRALFRTASITNFPQTPNVAASLFEHPAATFKDKMELLSYLDLSKNDRYFLGLYGRLDAAQRKDPDAQFLMVRYLLGRGRMEEAKKMLETYFAAGGKEPRFTGLQARMLLFGAPATQEQGQKMVASLMQNGDDVSKQAFGLLWDVPPKLLRPELYPSDLSEWVAKLPNAGAKEKLIVAQIELAKAPDDKNRQEDIFRKAVADLAASDPEILCDWLTRFQKFDLILGVADEEKGRKSVALFDHRLRSLATMQGIDAAEAWLANPLPDASSLQIWLSRAKLARLRKDRTQEQKCWKEALTVAEVDETCAQFLPIFRTALGLREMDVACRALLEAASHPGAAFPTSIEIQPVIAYLYSQDRLKDLGTICQRILQEEPGNVVLLNNVIYVSLILDNPVENSVALAKEMVTKYPKVLGIRTTLALGLRKQKQSKEALPFLDSPDADWKAASPADLTIRALVLEDCSETARAEEVRKQINQKQLTRTERRAFATVFKDEAPVLDPDQLYAEVRSWIVQGGHKHAHQLLEDYFATGGSERRFHVLFAQLLLGLDYAENDPIRGQEMVVQLLGDSDEHARKALALLADFPAGLIRPSIFPPDLIAWVKNLPSPVISEVIAATKIDAQRAQDQPTRERILSNLIASSGKSEPLAVAALLSELESYPLLLSFVDEKAARTSPKLRDYRLQAILKLQGSEAAQKWLDSAQRGDETPQAKLSAAKLRHTLGDTTGSLSALQEASSLAARDPVKNHFLAIYETATELGQLNVATRALISASLHPQREIPPSSKLTPILTRLYASDQLNDLHTVARTLASQDRNNDTLRNLEAYLALILHDPTSRALETSEALVKDHPTVLGFRTTRALALTLAEKYDEALQVLPQEGEAWNHASPMDFAILALAQENVGNAPAAAATRARFEPDDLTLTERRTFTEAKRKLPPPPQ